VRDPAHVAASVELDSRAIQTAALSAGIRLGEDGALVGLDASQADVSALLAAPSLAVGCRVLGNPKSFPHAVDGQTAVHWEDIKVRKAKGQAVVDQWLGVPTYVHKIGCTHTCAPRDKDDIVCVAEG
jgi:hypothetical protein